MSNDDDLYNQLTNRIQEKFHDSRLGFVQQTFADREELWVYVLQADKFQAIEEFCKSLGVPQTERGRPIKILTKTWTGPWPGGESDEEIRRRREEFLRRVRARTA